MKTQLQEEVFFFLKAADPDADPTLPPPNITSKNSLVVNYYWNNSQLSG
jgi:hypothetical protein